MTQGEVLKKYGIVYMSNVEPDEEADDNFEDFIREIVENFDKLIEEGEE